MADAVERAPGGREPTQNACLFFRWRTRGVGKGATEKPRTCGREPNGLGQIRLETCGGVIRLDTGAYWFRYRLPRSRTTGFEFLHALGERFSVAAFHAV